ncbi:hypothetical protein M9H77_36357 [Catharanthus roseus]|uniref:Uncharacterized protein n=1 Tax=Catharanthus roseus TaxID=4058 RepID=A0ACB9ZTS5_CATRO|nr:hypothetical protein M9H77_36357 [Catharanthus roseus]
MFESQNEVIIAKFRHLVFNTSQTPYEHSIYITTTLPQSLVKSGYKFLRHQPGQLTATLIRMGFSYVCINRKATCLAVVTESSHKHFRSAKIPIRQSSPAYENLTIMPILDLYSCMSKHVTFQARAFSNI